MACEKRGPSGPSPLPTPVGTGPRLSRSRFLAFGDSLTAGVTSPALSLLTTLDAGLPQSFPFMLQSLLRARYAAQFIEIANQGRPGEAASDAVRRLPDILRSFAPEVVILLHGVNDATLLGAAGAGRVAEYVNTMARDARFAGAEVVICTYPPQRPGGFRAADEGVMAAYNAALRDVARGEGALLVDFEAEVDLRLIGMDGLHPIDDGQARMAAILFDRLRGRYEIVP